MLLYSLNIVQNALYNHGNCIHDLYKMKKIDIAHFKFQLLVNFPRGRAKNLNLCLKEKSKQIVRKTLGV